MTVKSQLSDDQMDQTSKYSYLDVKVFLKEKNVSVCVILFSIKGDVSVCWCEYLSDMYARTLTYYEY